VNVLRRLPLSRLLLLCVLVIAIGVTATALASALSGRATPPAKLLAQAAHDALAGTPVEGVSANITLTDHLLEGSSLASAAGSGGAGGAAGLASSPLLTGGSGRLWIAKDGRVRLELQAEKGDTQIISDGHTISMYDAANNTLYRYTPKPGEAGAASTQKSPATGSTASKDAEATPSLARIEEAITHIKQHVQLSEPTPANVGGQPAYTVRVSPKESGSLLGGAELSFDAAHGVPLRAAIYSSTSSAPVIELAATEVSYGPVESSVFSVTPPPGVKVEDISIPTGAGASAKHSSAKGAGHKLSTHGQGITAVEVLESPVKPGSKQGSSSALEGLPKVNINGATATELRTALGTVLSFERSGVRFVVAGSVTPAAIEALARGL
jgi:outer membrane lipoprotein-sorting protein